MILEATGINTFYGPSHILFDVDLYLNEGEVIALMGRNGSGKTTTILSIMGITPPRSGSIKYMGEEITSKKPFIIARKGIGFVPEDRRIFPSLTVLENLQLAIKSSKKGGTNWKVEKAFDFFPVLKTFSNRRGQTLSGGEQQMLSIARALVGNPQIMLLDEPAEGLAPLIVKMLVELLLQIKEQGIPMLLTEQQHLKFAMTLSDRVYIIDKGEIKYHGESKEFQENEELKKKYLAV
jgi:branched-chain amino acid transport system ATP-binding protein